MTQAKERNGSAVEANLKIWRGKCLDEIYLRNKIPPFAEGSPVSLLH